MMILMTTTAAETYTLHGGTCTLHGGPADELVPWGTRHELCWDCLDEQLDMLAMQMAGEPAWLAKFFRDGQLEPVTGFGDLDFEHGAAGPRHGSDEVDLDG
jgi:hypothetical protein